MIYTKQEWYTPAEVSIHNTASDCWVSLNGKVLDLSNWLREHSELCKCTKFCSCWSKNWFCKEECLPSCQCHDKGYPFCDAKRLTTAIIAYAGKDISHWFHGDDWINYTHPITGVSVPYHRYGPDIGQPVVPSPRWRPIKKPWWLDESLVVGKATAKTRPIQITNSLTGSTVTLEVCSEETIYQIMTRYFPHNSHAMSYAWRYLGRRVCLQKTLDQNGIPDERERFSEVGLPENTHIPALMLYYNDDLTEDAVQNVCHCTVAQACLAMDNPENCQ